MGIVGTQQHRNLAVHGDTGCSGVDIGNGAHITTPIDKTIAFIGYDQQVHLRPFIVHKVPLARDDYAATLDARDSETILNRTTAHHPGNKGYYNQRRAKPFHIYVLHLKTSALHVQCSSLCQLYVGVHVRFLEKAQQDPAS